LLHELVHIKRGDHLMRLLELTVSVAYWWLPIVSSIGRQLRECEEACCDAAVVARLPQARRDYARLLLDVLDFVYPVPRPSIPQATAMSAAQGLEERLRTILDASHTTRRAWPVAAFALGIACAVLPCGFQYDFSRRPVSASISAGQEAPAAEVCLPDDAPKIDRSLSLCCPS
jgi:beta-lactamase regulating signal transducer with metallopeptidase domain